VSFAQLLCAAFTVLLFGAAASAQGTFGRLAGTVFDAGGGVLPGVTITLTSEQTGQVQTTVDGRRGAFLFAQLQPGPTRRDDADRLPHGAIRERRHRCRCRAIADGAPGSWRGARNGSVTGGSPLVQTTTPEVTQTVVQRQILELPLLNRDPLASDSAAGGRSRHRDPHRNRHQRWSSDWTQVTQDGINIQDNFIRVNALNFSPNRPTSDTSANSRSRRPCQVLMPPAARQPSDDPHRLDEPSARRSVRLQQQQRSWGELLFQQA
jgi:hypothetical protein